MNDRTDRQRYRPRHWLTRPGRSLARWLIAVAAASVFLAVLFGLVVFIDMVI